MQRCLYIIVASLLACFCLAGCAKTATPTPATVTKKAGGQTYTITAPKDGKAIGLILEKGERISKDQPLFAMQDDVLKAQMAKVTTEIAKEEARLKVMQTGVTTVAPLDVSALTAAQNAAQQKANKFNNLLAQGAVSRKQAEQAQQELTAATQALQAASRQGLTTQPASKEAQAVQQQKLTALKAEQDKIRKQLQSTEVNSPATCIVKEVKIKNGATVKKDQVIMILEEAQE